MQVGTPDNCKALDDAQGRSYYKSRRTGKVDFPDSKYDDLKASWAYQNDMLAVGTKLSIAGQAGKHCPNRRCRYSGWAWQDTCPRCGGELIDD